MFRAEVNDLHMHLNGSVSLEFLEKIAKRNNKLDCYESLLTIRAEYESLRKTKSRDEVAALIPLLWKQFEFIHNIIQNVRDIQDATVDVIQHSTADYLEIRTCPKALGSEDWNRYIDAFVKGLVVGNVANRDKKARGLLSLDRTLHNKKDGFELIDKIVAEKSKHGLIVGLDISGNPYSKRTLTGTDLQDVIRYALSKEIGIGIHIGEVNNEVEKNEVDGILAVLNDWYKVNKTDQSNPFEGRIRLGHSIFLTAQQKTLIGELQLPVEICPSCHRKINYWLKGEPHPVKSIYPLWHKKKIPPVVPGTDDFTLFNKTAHREANKTFQIMRSDGKVLPDAYLESEREATFSAQSRYRFS